MNIRFLLHQRAEQFADKTALVFRDETVSFNDLEDRVLRLGQAFRALGVGRSDRVAIHLPNCPEYVYCYLACFSIGAVAVPLDFMLKEDELISCLDHSETKLLIAQPKPDVSLPKIKESVKSLETIFLHRAPEDGPSEGYMFAMDFLVDQVQGCPELVDVEDPDLALIMYTSGTTGKPKGIMLNYKHLEGSPRAMEHFVDLTDKDVKLAAIPFSHVGGLVYIQNCVVFGLKLVIMDRFNPIEFLKNVQEHKVTCFHIVPAMYNALLSLKQIEKFDLSSLRWMVVFGAPSTPEVLERFRKYCPNTRLLNGWGMTETCPPNTVTPLDSDNIASVGKPAPHCTIRVVDEEDKELPAGEVGEIVIRGWVVMDGYYKDPEGTAAVMKNGWLHTGDLGLFDEEGFLYIRGRKKEMIKVGGQIVYAPEVESALHRHEGVAEVAVIGMSDTMRGEVVKAFVVLKEGVQLNAEDLRYFAKEHLANFKVPQTIELRADLPKNRTGKIDKELLKKGI